jgi:hypothetical protein
MRHKIIILVCFLNLKVSPSLFFIRNNSFIVWNIEAKFFLLKDSEKGQLLEIHLLKKTARHQNLDCSTPFEQMTKIY